MLYIHYSLGDRTHRTRSSACLARVFDDLGLDTIIPETGAILDLKGCGRVQASKVQCRSTTDDDGATTSRDAVLLVARRAVGRVVEIDGSGYLRHAGPGITGDLVSDRQGRYEIVYLIGVTAKATIFSEIYG
jgi:hypothetical protein